MAIIEFTNNVQLSQQSVEGDAGIDVNNVIASNVGGSGYTATEDGWWATCYLDNGQIYIDGKLIVQATAYRSWPIPLKKGQTLRVSDNGWKGTFYGLKK